MGVVFDQTYLRPGPRCTGVPNFTCVLSMGLAALTLYLGSRRKRGRRIPAAEWAIRVELAAAYQACHHYGYNEGIENHLTAAVSDPAGIIPSSYLSTTSSLPSHLFFACS
jgi:hypothetical protein